MKKLLLSSAVAAVMFALYVAWACHVSAQQPPAQGYGAPSAAPAPSVVLIDVNYIFKRHVRLKAQLKELQNEGEVVQKGFEEKMKALQEQSKQLAGSPGASPNAFKPGSIDYKNLEEELVRKQSDIKTEIALKRKEFVQREAKLYFGAYHEITDDVTYFCQQRGITMAMNFNGDAIDPESPETVARGISGKFVYYNKALDITPVILKDFERPISADANGGGNPNLMTPH